jgi:hypothetical protein
MMEDIKNTEKLEAFSDLAGGTGTHKIRQEGRGQKMLDSNRRKGKHVSRKTRRDRG